MAIIGVSMLFAGLQSSVLGDNIVTSVMLIVVGIILLFVGLIMVLGKANIIANDLELPGSKKEEKNNFIKISRMPKFGILFFVLNLKTIEKSEKTC